MLKSPGKNCAIGSFVFPDTLSKIFMELDGVGRLADSLSLYSGCLISTLSSSLSPVSVSPPVGISALLNVPSLLTVPA